jgi:O-antigen ligase
MDIIHTGNFRALGFIGYAIMDFTPLVLLFYIFRNYLFVTANLYIYVTSFLLFLLTIFHQSRFAWLGFIITLTYGIVISMKYFPEVKLVLRKRSSVLIIVILIFFGFLFVSGYSSLIFSRVSEINFEFFQGTPEEGQFVSNSLESRLLIWITAFNVFIKQPFFGVGYFMFPIISDQYNILPAIVFRMYVEGLDAHTTYFNYLVETGIFGFISFLSLVIYMFAISFRSIKLSICTEQRRLSLILNIYCFFVMSHSIYSGAFTFGLNSYHMWLMYSLVVVNYVMVKKRIKLERVLSQ